MREELQRTAAWIATFALLLFVVIGATRAARHCLLNRELSIKVGIVHRVAAPFWGLYCARSDLRRAVF
jgi:hypothetical protein